MSTIIFKRLFEVRVLQDYYLAMGDSGISFFGLDEDQQNSRLEELLKTQQYDVWNDLQFSPTKNTKIAFQGNKLRMLRTSLGFVVALEVKRLFGPDGSIFYKPLIPFRNDFRMGFTLANPTTNFPIFSNLTLQKDPLPVRYYFSNNSGQVLGSAKVLSSSLPTFDSSGSYEMGDLVRENDSSSEVFFDLQDDTPIAARIDGNGFVHKGDKVLLPKKFTYQFSPPKVGSAQFRLLDRSGTAVKVIEKDSIGGFGGAILDFSSVENAPISNGSYHLEVFENGNLMEDRSLFLHDTYDSNTFGLMEFQPVTANPSFTLLDGEGQLITRIDSNGDKVSHPIFELRILSRRTFWRYRKSGGFNPGDVGISDELVLQGDKLTSETPRRLSRSLTSFRSNTGANMPSPLTHSVKVENKRLFSDIYVSAINQLQ